MHRIDVIDSHTGGEPTRVVMAGGPDLGEGSLRDRCDCFRREHDRFRSAIVNEPRGSDILVGALPVPPQDPSCVTGVIFFNNVGYLGMCGHGMIGLLKTLELAGKVKPGRHRVETPVGIVATTLHPDGKVSVENVVSWRENQAVTATVPKFGPVTGDVAYGGNWFFLIESPGPELALENVEALSAFCWNARQAVNRQGFPLVDHIEIFTHTPAGDADSRNFVLCPGKAYDRSPCGTGTSAKLACLAANGQLEEGDMWIQEGITGSRFHGSYRWIDRAGGRIVPVITGRAFINAESTLILDAQDPCCWGVAAK